MPIVQRPLAAVIARGDRGDPPPARPRRAARSASPACPPTKPWSTPRSAPTAATRPRSTRVTIGFNAVASLAAGKVDAATGFWNAEGVALRRQGVPIRIFKVDRYGAPPYPELVLTTSRQTLDSDPSWSNRCVAATDARLRIRRQQHPAQALDDLLAEVPSLDRGEQAAQLQRPAARPAPGARSTPRSCTNGPPGTSSTACSNGRSTSTSVRRAVRRPRRPSASSLSAGSSSRSASSGSSRAIRERGTTRSMPAASAASLASRRRRASSSRGPGRPRPTSASGFSASRSATSRSAPSSGASASDGEASRRGRPRVSVASTLLPSIRSAATRDARRGH